MILEVYNSNDHSQYSLFLNPSCTVFSSSASNELAFILMIVKWQKHINYLSNVHFVCVVRNYWSLIHIEYQHDNY